MSDHDWLARVRHLLSVELQREYERRMRAVRQNAQRHAWRRDPVRRIASA